MCRKTSFSYLGYLWLAALLIVIFASIKSSHAQSTGQIVLSKPLDFSGNFTYDVSNEVTFRNEIGGLSCSGLPVAAPTILTLRLVDRFSPDPDTIRMEYEGEVTFFEDAEVGFNIDEATSVTRVIRGLNATYLIEGTVDWKLDKETGGFRMQFTNGICNPFSVSILLSGGSGECGLEAPQFVLEGAEGCLQELSVPNQLICGGGACSNVTDLVEDSLTPDNVRDFFVNGNLSLGYVMRFNFGSIFSPTSTSNECGDKFGRVSGIVDCGIGPRIVDMGNGRPSLLDFKASIKGEINSSLPVATTDDNDVEQATVALLKQEGFIRNQRPDETDEEFQKFLNSQEKDLVNCVRVKGEDLGRFSFEDISIFETTSTGTRPLYYTVKVSNAETQEVDVNQFLPGTDSESIITDTLYFTDADVLNIRPGAGTVTVEVAPFDGIGTKEDLVNTLGTTTTGNYIEIENLVQLFLNKVKKPEEEGGIEKTGELSEALKRAIWAERVVRDGAIFSDELISLMLDGLANLLSDLIDTFNFWKNSDLANKQGRLNNLNEAFDAEVVRNRGWQRIDTSTETATRIRESITRLLGDNQLGASELARFLKSITTVLFQVVKSGLTAAGLEDRDAGSIASGVQIAINTIFDTVINSGFTGSRAGQVGRGLQSVAKAAVAEAVKNGKDKLFDGFDDVVPVPFSYTALTKDTLKFSQERMESWDTDDNAAYIRDRGEVVDILSQMGDDSTLAIRTVIVSSGIAEAADAAEPFLDLAGRVFPIGKVFEVILKVSKWVSNATSFGVPLGTVYGVIGGPGIEIAGKQIGLVEKGVAKAYGETTLQGDPDTFKNIFDKKKMEQRASIFASAENTDIKVTPNPNLLSAVEQARKTMNAALDQIITNLKDDFIPDAIFITSGEEEENVVNSVAKLLRAIKHLTLQTLGANSTDEIVLDDLQTFIESEGNFRIEYAELSEMITDLYLKVLLLVYTGPTDPLYITERNNIISKIESFKRSGDKLIDEVTTIFNKTKDTPTLPAVVVDNILTQSDKTGGTDITLSPEDFTLNAHIKNISTIAVSGLSVRLNVNSMEDSITVSTPLEVTVDNGMLAADDGADGTGEDEADGVWQFRFSGDPTIAERIIFSFEILEQGETPTTFITFPDLRILETDVSFSDKDLDGLPDEYERANGLDDAKDDSQDDRDNDGLVNLVEFRLGTNPQNSDTDSDGLSDGEEVTGGEDGFVTDPFNSDSDDDGVLDNSDGLPIDGGTAEPPEPDDEIIGKPEVIIDKDEVSMTEEERVTTISVSNGGSGTLIWSAVSDNSAIALVSPNSPEVRQDEGLVFISAPPSFDFDTMGILKTTVRVFNVNDTIGDVKEITVKVGSGEERISPEGPESTPRPTPEPGQGVEPGTIFGVAVDEAGNPIQGAMVIIKRRGFKEETLTDEDGFFEFIDLEPGRYRIIINAKEFRKERKIFRLNPEEGVDLGTITLIAK